MLLALHDERYGFLMKRNSLAITLAASVSALGLALTGCANQSGGASSDETGEAGGLPVVDTIDVPENVVKAAGKGDAKCDSDTTIAYVGAQTGDNAQLGLNISNGVQQAINEHNEANKDCQVKLVKLDTEGDPSKATGPTSQVVKNSKVLGVVGLPFSGESKSTGKVFEDAGLVHITPAATGPDLTANGWKTFFRGLGNDTVQGPALAQLAEKIGKSKVCLIQDDSEYGMGLAKQTKAALGDKVVCEDKVLTKQRDFAPTVTKVMSAKADAVIYSGYYAEGAPFDSALVDKGYEGVFIGPDGVKDDTFVKQAGDAAKNAYFTCACVPGDLIPEFSEGYTKVSNGKAPGTYSVEGYDTVTVLLSGIDAGKTDRKGLLDYVTSYDGVGYGKTYKWDDKGELTDKAVYGYKTDGDTIKSVGKID